jgi:hypothetical protein
MNKKYNTLNEEINRMKQLFGGDSIDYSNEYKYKAPTPINEEVGRIKSLFTEERLYGNLVDKTPKLITEQKWGKILDDLFKGFLKGKNTKITFKSVKGDSRGPITIKKVGDGVEITRGGKKIDLNSMDDILSTVTLRKIKTDLSDIMDENTLRKFLDGEGFEKVQRDIINDLKFQGFMDELEAEELIRAIKEQNIGKEISDRLFTRGRVNKDYFKNIYSLSDLKRVNPELYRYFEDIPGFEVKLKNALKKSDNVDFYDDNTVDLIRFIRGTDSGEDLLKYIDYSSNNPNQVIFNIPSSKRVEIDKIKKSFPDKDQVFIVGAGNDRYKVIIKTDTFDEKTQKFFDDAFDVSRTKNLDIEVKDVGRNRSKIIDTEDINKQVDNIINSMDDAAVRKSRGVRSNKDIIANIKASLGKAADYVKPITDTVKDTFSRKYFKGYDWVNWKKKGYGKGVGIDSKLQLNEVQQRFADDLLVVEGRPNGKTTPWIDAELDPDLIKKGYPEGTLHPNAKLTPDWRTKIYMDNSKFLNRSVQSLFPKAGFKDFISWNKHVGRVMKRLVLFMPYGEGILITHLFTKMVHLISAQIMRGAINAAIASDTNIYSLSEAYTATCAKAISSNIKNSKVLNDESKRLLMGLSREQKGTDDKGEYTQTEEISPGQIKEVINMLGEIKISRDNGSITGDAPIYSPIDYADLDVFEWFTEPGGIQDDKFLDVLSEDKREIVEDKVVYEIDSAIGMAGDSWEVVSYKDIPADKLSGVDVESLGPKNRPFLLVYVNDDGSLCNSRKSNDCGKVYFSLSCGKFSDFFNKYSKDEIRKIVEDIGWGVFYSYFWGNAQTIQELFVEKVNDAKIEVLDTIDADDDGEITIDDVKDNVKDATEKVTGKISGGVGGVDPDNKGSEIFNRD